MPRRRSANVKKEQQGSVGGGTRGIAGTVARVAKKAGRLRAKPAASAVKAVSRQMKSSAGSPKGVTARRRSGGGRGFTRG